MSRVLRWVTPLLFGVQVVLVLTGVLSVAQAAVVLVVVEAALLIGGVATIGLGRRRYRAARDEGEQPWDAFATAVRSVLPPPIAAVLLWEAGTVRNGWLAARRRVDGQDAALDALPYHSGMGALMAMLTALAVVEVGVVHLIVPWPAARVVLLILGVWTVMVVLGFWLGLRTHPHLVTTSGLRLRYAHYLSIGLNWDDIAHVQRANLYEPTSVTVTDGRLHLPVSGSTNLLVRLHETRPMPLLFGLVRPAHEIAFHADDPDHALRAIRNHLTAST